MKKYRIVCSWPGEIFVIQKRVDALCNNWEIEHFCIEKGEAGYMEAKQWLKEHDK